MKKTLALLIAFAANASVCFAAPPPDMSVREIVKRSDELMRGDTREGKYALTIINPQWERHLAVYVYGKGRDKVFLRILSPDKEKGIATLRVGNSMWQYMPKVERTMNIPPSMMSQSWMGSDFDNDDMVKESSDVDDFTHKLLVEEVVNGFPAYRIELIPKEGVTLGRRVLWIAKDTFVPLREEFYGRDNKLIKVLTYSNVRKVGDRNIPTSWEMVSEVRKGYRTIIEVDDGFVYNGPVDDSVFDIRNLKKQ